MQKNQYVLDLESAATASGLRISFPTLFSLASKYNLPIPGFRAVTERDERMRGYASESLSRYQRLVDADPKNLKPTLFTKLYQANEIGKGLPYSSLRDNAMGYIVAGSDTTAVTLTYLVWSVCRNPSVHEKLIEELGNLDEQFTDADLKGLNCLNQVIMESLRLYSAVPGALPREVPNGGVQLEGWFVPGETTVSTQAQSLHKNERVFEEPHRYAILRCSSLSTIAPD